MQIIDIYRILNRNKGIHTLVLVDQTMEECSVNITRNAERIF